MGVSVAGLWVWIKDKTPAAGSWAALRGLPVGLGGSEIALSLITRGRSGARGAREEVTRRQRAGPLTVTRRWRFIGYS